MPDTASSGIRDAVRDASAALACYEVAVLEPDDDRGYHERIDAAIDCIEPLRALLASVRPADETAEELARVVKVLDQHLPTVLAGLGVISRATMHMNRDELTPEDVATRAAYSAAHWIAKEIAVGSAKPLYDLPSVVDLLETTARVRTEKTELVAGISELHPVVEYQHYLDRGDQPRRFGCPNCSSVGPCPTRQLVERTR